MRSSVPPYASLARPRARVAARFCCLPLSSLLAGGLLVCCGDPRGTAQPVQPPPPLPTLGPVPAEAERVDAYAPPSAGRGAKPAKPKPHGQPASSAGPAKETKAKSAPPPMRSESASTARPPAPAAAPPTPQPGPAGGAPTPLARPTPSNKRVVVPRTSNVHVDYPLGLQSDLDADPRMQAWVDKVITIVDGCHAKDRSATGAISTRITMHENDRPDADILALPGQLSSVVACSTGALMRVKMPLFTGREGTRYDVRIVFE